jgi:hypothetical protein
MSSLGKLQAFLHGDEALFAHERHLNDLKTSEIGRRVQRLQKQLKVYYLSLFGLIARLSAHASSLFREDLIVSKTHALDLTRYAPFSSPPKADDRYYLSFIPSVFNFFLTRSVADEFILRLRDSARFELNTDGIAKVAVSLFLSPQFTNFTSHVFKPLFVPLVRKSEDVHALPLAGRILANWKANRALCPCYIGSFVTCLGESLQKSHADVLFCYFLVPMFELFQAALDSDRIAPSTRCVPASARTAPRCPSVSFRGAEFAAPGVFRSRLIDTDDTLWVSDKPYKGLAYQFFRHPLPSDDSGDPPAPPPPNDASATLRQLLKLSAPLPPSRTTARRAISPSSSALWCIRGRRRLSTGAGPSIGG